MSRRLLHINNQEWKYSVGDSFVNIWSPNGIRTNYRINQFTDVDIERRKHKGCYWGGIQPSEIKLFIQRNLLKMKHIPHTIRTKFSVGDKNIFCILFDKPTAKYYVKQQEVVSNIIVTVSKHSTQIIYEFSSGDRAEEDRCRTTEKSAKRLAYKLNPQF